MAKPNPIVCLRLNPITIHQLDTYRRHLAELDHHLVDQPNPKPLSRSTVIRTAIHRFLTDQYQTEPNTA